MIVRTGCLAGAVLAASVAGLSAQLTDAAAREIDERARQLIQEPMIPGLAVGIVIDDELVYARGFGVADRDTGRPVTAESIFQIGSTSKSFTSTLLGILLDRGTIGLEDPIARHLPGEVPYPVWDGQVATVEQVASHTAGLPRDAPTLRRAHGDAPVLAFSHFELYQSIERAELEFEPGTSWSYSNLGFGVLGHAIERAADTPYEVLLFRELTGPLGMRSTTVTLWPRYDSLLARPYYPNTRTGLLEDYTPWDQEALAPAGGLASTVGDLAQFVRLHLGGQPSRRPVLSDATRDELHRTRSQLNDTVGYALGWMNREVDGVGRVVEHGGEIDGYTSFVGFSPEHGVGVILLMNAGNGPLPDLADWIFRHVLADR